MTGMCEGCVLQQHVADASGPHAPEGRSANPRLALRNVEARLGACRAVLQVRPPRPHCARVPVGHHRSSSSGWQAVPALRAGRVRGGRERRLLQVSVACCGRWLVLHLQQGSWGNVSARTSTSVVVLDRLIWVGLGSGCKHPPSQPVVREAGDKADWHTGGHTLQQATRHPACVRGERCAVARRHARPPPAAGTRAAASATTCLATCSWCAA
jgi:hypothetical protein